MVLGNCYPSGENPAIGRIAALDAGLGTGVPGLQLDRRCGSGLQAVLYAASQIASGAGSVIVAGGVESMSNVEHYALGLRTGIRSGGVELMDRLVRARETAGGKDHPVPGGMLETAENLRRDYGITREEQDELSVRSQQRAGAAHEAGRFADELVPVTVPGRRGQPDVVVDRDEHPRPETTLEQLAALRPVRAKLDAESTVTAGNASGQNDGAAMCVVTTREEAERRGLRPLLALRSWAVAGVGPEVMGIGPVPATAAALDRAGLTLDEIDLIELNEAFAAQVLACLREWKVDADRRAPQPQRLRHLPRSPRGRDRGPHPRHAGPRDAAPRGALRPRDHVHRRRPGPRRDLRAGHLMSAVCRPPHAPLPWTGRIPSHPDRVSTVHQLLDRLDPARRGAPVHFEPRSPSMDDYPLLDLMFTMLWFYIIVAWLWFLISLMTDVLRSRDLSGVMKAMWMLFLLFVPFIAAVVYLIARGDSMNERRMQEHFSQAGVPGRPSAADEISKLAALRDSGALTDDEFAAQKSRVLGV